MSLQLFWLFAIPISLLLLWLAWRRPNQQRLVWRMLASIVAGISLLLLVFPPATQHAISPSTAVLLTEGYNPDTLRQLLQETAAAPTIYRYQTVAKDALPLQSLTLLRQQQPGLAQVHLLGYGLSQKELQLLDGLQLIPHLSDNPTGMTAGHWPETVTLGETVEVAGKYKSNSKYRTKLYLQATGQKVDSVEMASSGSVGFKLRHTPKLAGQFAYTITRKTNQGIDTIGMIPVKVQPVKELSVLMLASSPLPEFRFLKNHLAEQQHRIALRTTVSKDLSQQEWLNIPRTSLDRLTPTLLQQFDVVITEPQALQQLSAKDHNTLQRAVTEDGLGVLTITDSPANNRSTAFFTSFPARKQSQQENRIVQATWDGDNGVPVSAAPYSLTNTTAVTGLVTAAQDQLLAGAKQAGWGKVALSLVPQTFPWKLAGKQQVYASYWATLLSAVAKQQAYDKFWQVASPQVPHPNQPLSLTFTDYSATGEALPIATVTALSDSSTISLPLAQHAFEPTRFSGTFWPSRSGWHEVRAESGTSYRFLVQDTTAWNFATHLAQRNATEAYIARQNAVSVSEPLIAYQEKPVDLIWFFVLFVLSSGFLWLEEKF